MQHNGRILFLLSLWLSGSLGIHAQPLAQRFSFSRPLMGTEIRMVLYAKGAGQAQYAAEAAYAQLDSLNHILSDYDPESELNQLCQTAGSRRKVPVSDPLWAVLTAAEEMAQASQGAFDVSVGPLSRLWRRAFRRQRFPDSTKLAEARAHVNYRWIKRYPRRQAVKLKRPDMQLDLGGIAKGYAATAALRVLREQGHIAAALVDAGGDIALTGGQSLESGGWQIAVPDLDSAGSLTQRKVRLSSGSIATSGDHYRFLEQDSVRYSHIIDPRSGLGMQDQRLVTVLHRDGMWADAWASVLSVATDPVALLEEASLFAPEWVQIIWEGPGQRRRWQWGLRPDTGPSTP